MLTKVIRILDININMDKFYMSIFVYILESRNVILENEKIEQLKDVLEKEIAEQTEYILSNGFNSIYGYDSLTKLSKSLSALASISTIEAEEKSKLAYDVILNQTKNIDFSNIDMNSMKDMVKALNKNI